MLGSDEAGKREQRGYLMPSAFDGHPSPAAESLSSGPAWVRRSGDGQHRSRRPRVSSQFKMILAESTSRVVIGSNP